MKFNTPAGPCIESVSLDDPVQFATFPSATGDPDRRGRMAYSLGPDFLVIHWFDGDKSMLPAVCAFAKANGRTRILWVVERKTFIPVLFDAAATLTDWESPHREGDGF